MCSLKYMCVEKHKNIGTYVNVLASKCARHSSIRSTLNMIQFMLDEVHYHHQPEI